ncbi:hypothetical protein PFISCL1PPCAC_25962, partial [Pristionchus fissidentatus]
KDYDKLKCVFEINKRSPTARITQGSYKLESSKATVKAPGVPDFATNSRGSVTVPFYCVPGVFPMPRDKIDENKRYAKVQYNWELNDHWDGDKNNMYCDEPNIYKTIEYLNEDYDKYREIKSLYCKEGYNLDTGEGPPGKLNEDFNLRCVADADYFCDYDPLAAKNPKADEKALVRQKPALSASPEKGHIACPADYPFFVIKGRLPVRNAEIKCKNHYGQMRWTYNGTMLNPDGPEVYCVNKLSCHVMNKIPRTNLKGSFMNEKFLPTCQSGGVLKVRNGDSKEKVNKDDKSVHDVKCDQSNGQYAYLLAEGGTEYPIKSDTFFLCYYDANDKAQEQYDRDKNKVWYAVGIAIFVVLMLTVPAFIVMCLWTRYKAKRIKNHLHKGHENDSGEFNIYDAIAPDEPGKKNDNNDLLANDYLQKKMSEASKMIKKTTL